MKYFTIRTTNYTMGKMKELALEFGHMVEDKTSLMTRVVFENINKSPLINLLTLAYIEGKFDFNLNEVRNIKTVAEMTSLCNECKAIAKLSDKYLKNKEQYKDLNERIL